VVSRIQPSGLSIPEHDCRSIFRTHALRRVWTLLPARVEQVRPRRRSRQHRVPGPQPDASRWVESGLQNFLHWWLFLKTKNNVTSLSISAPSSLHRKYSLSLSLLSIYRSVFLFVFYLCVCQYYLSFLCLYVCLYLILSVRLSLSGSLFASFSFYVCLLVGLVLSVSSNTNNNIRRNGNLPKGNFTKKSTCPIHSSFYVWVQFLASWFFEILAISLSCPRQFLGDHQNTTNLILDHETFWLNLTESNQLSSGSGIQLRPEYSAKIDFKLQNMSPKSWWDFSFVYFGKNCRKNDCDGSTFCPFLSPGASYGIRTLALMILSRVFYHVSTRA